MQDPLTENDESAMKGPLLLLLVAISCQVTAEIYKWTDDQGRVHYGDRAFGEAAQTMKIRPAPESQGPASGNSEAERAQRRQRLLDIYREERVEKEAAREQHRQQRAERRENCRRARLEYDRYNNSRALYDYQPDGERRYLSEAEREEYIAGLQRRIKQFCD